MGVGGVSERFEVVVVGSGAGGGVVAGELAAQRPVGAAAGGRRAPHRRGVRALGGAGPPTTSGGRLRFAFPAGDPGLGPVVLIGGRCVGGSTTINTKVALRASPARARQVARRQRAAQRARRADLARRSRSALRPGRDGTWACGVRTDWDLKRCVQTAKRGFDAVGAHARAGDDVHRRELRPVRVVPAGLPDELRQVDAEHLHPAHSSPSGALTLRPESHGAADRDRGPRRRRPRRPASSTPTRDGARHEVDADAIVAACGSLSTPLLLLRSGGAQRDGRPHAGAASGAVRVRAVRRAAGLAHGRADHQPLPGFAADDAGGFVVEAVTVQDPIGFAASLCDENGPMWGQPLVDAARAVPPLGRVAQHVKRRQQRDRSTLDADGGEQFTCELPAPELERIQSALEFSRQVLEAAGAEPDPVVVAGDHAHAGQLPDGQRPVQLGRRLHGESHEVKRLYVGDSSADPAHAVGQPVADDHGAGQPAGRAPRRQRQRLPQRRRSAA